MITECRRDQVVFEQCFSALAMLAAGKPIEGVTLRAFCYVERLCLKHDRSMFRQNTFERIKSIGIEELQKSMDHGVYLVGNSNTRARAVGLVSRINRGMRKNKLPMPQVDSSYDGVDQDEVDGTE